MISQHESPSHRDCIFETVMCAVQPYSCRGNERYDMVEARAWYEITVVWEKAVIPPGFLENAGSKLILDQSAGLRKTFAVFTCLNQRHKDEILTTNSSDNQHNNSVGWGTPEVTGNDSSGST